MSQTLSLFKQSLDPKTLTTDNFWGHGGARFANRQFFDWRCKDVEWLSL